MFKLPVASESTSHTATTKRTRRNLLNEEILSNIVSAFDTIWEKSKEDPKYSASFSKIMKPCELSYSSIRTLKQKAFQLHILVPVKETEVRFRTGLAKPNLMMIKNIIETPLDTPKSECIPELEKFSDQVLVKELRNRGYNITCEKIVKIKL